MVGTDAEECFDGPSISGSSCEVESLGNSGENDGGKPSKSDEITLTGPRARHCCSQPSSIHGLSAGQDL